MKKYKPLFKETKKIIFPKNLTKMSDNQKKHFINELLKYNLKELRRRQGINKLQMINTYEKLEKLEKRFPTSDFKRGKYVGSEMEILVKGYKNLQIIDNMLIQAVDKKVFEK